MTPAQQIARGSRLRGLDPQAVLAVAGVEGLGARRPGDQGTSFGPFQLHMGGALPRQHYGDAAQWSSSPQGIAYALNQIGRVAHGLHGRAAVSAIVNQFERPQNPGAEIAKAWGRYGTSLGGGPASLPQQASPDPVGRVAAPDNRQQIGLALLNAVSPGAGHDDFSPVYQLLQQQQHAQPQQPHPSAGPTVEVGPGVHQATRQQAQIVLLAKRYLGTKYTWGGTSPQSGFDCSGFAQWLYAHSGIHIPRTSQEQWRQLKPATGALRPGDLVFFEQTASGPGHVGMFIGNNHFIESPHTGATVRISSLRGRSDYVGARRPG